MRCRMKFRYRAVAMSSGGALFAIYLVLLYMGYVPGMFK